VIRLSTTSSTSATALVLNAGADLAVGAYTGATSSVNPYGFNIILGSGKTITLGSGGTGKLYSGSVAGSGQALTTYVGSGSGKFRYNSNASTTNYTQALGTGLNLIYRQDPLLSVSSTSRSIVYGNSFSALTPTVSGLVNADTASGALQGLSESLTGNSLSTQGYTKVGSYAITPSSVSLLGYRTSSSNGTCSALSSFFTAPISANTPPVMKKQGKSARSVAKPWLPSGDKKNCPANRAGLSRKPKPIAILNTAIKPIATRITPAIS
jgi:hypothetical protein